MQKTSGEKLKSVGGAAPLGAIRNWAGQEEKIVRDYKEQRRALFARHSLRPESPEKSSPKAFETFSTQTTFSGIPGTSKTVRVPGKASRFFGKVLPVIAWLAACALVLVYVQGILSSREASRQLAQVQSEKKQLEQSYAALESTSVHQAAEMRWMSSQLRDQAAELKTAQDQKESMGRSLEKRYAEELMRITLQYESELDALRGAVQTRDAIVNALKAQMKAFEKFVNPAKIAAVSGGAAGISRQPFAGAGTPGVQGQILSVNGRQGFVVIDLGSERGAHSGRLVVISRNGTELTTGRVDRVYPSMSAVLIHDAGISSTLQEGDAVSFS
jgi:ElaB/YqjD/DUF883 family membrane-anchored ribosome-binding protein